jgi:transcriptional regulator with XRE-family HTH domain
MTRTHVEIMAARTARALRSTLADDLRKLCDDAGVSQAALGRISGVSAGMVSRILDGSVRPTLETYVRLSVALGADFHARLYANTGPAIRDRHQARIAEELIGMVSPRWRPFTEVAVRRPARGWIDVVLHEPRELVLVATKFSRTCADSSSSSVGRRTRPTRCRRGMAGRASERHPRSSGC